MDKGVLVANGGAWYPPTVHVGMISVGDVNGSPTPHLAFVAVIKIFQTGQVMQVPTDGGMLPIDLKRVEGLVSAGIARRFKKPKGAVVKMAMKNTSIVNPYRLLFARIRMDTLLHKGLGHRGNILDSSINPHGGIDAVRQQIPSNSGAS